MEPEDIIAVIIAAAGGNLTGRVRLQKVVYLLDQLGLESGFKFGYHHYGPYSAELTAATEDAAAFGLIQTKNAFRESDGALYNIFEIEDEKKIDETVYEHLKLNRDELKSLLNKMNQYSSTILELAATIHWLQKYEEIKDWNSEIRRRKSVKTGEGRLEQAMGFLDEIGLSLKTA